MTLYEKLIGLNKEDLAKEIHEMWRENREEPWTEWFCERYCTCCAPVYEKNPFTGEDYQDDAYLCSYCELNGRCRHFPELNEVPSDEKMILIWLSQQVK
jgi:hypothetical protein